MSTITVIYGVISALGLTAWQIASAGQLIDMVIQEQDGVYSVSVEMRIDAPSDEVYRVLTDYTHMYRLNPSITESRLLPSPRNGVVRVLTHLEDCVFFICLKIMRIDDIREVGYGHFLAETVPQQGDLKSGSTVWRIVPLDGYCHVVYEAHLQPDFILPPVFGAYMVKQRLQMGVLTSLSNLECIAKINAGLSNSTALQNREFLHDGQYECES